MKISQKSIVTAMKLISVLSKCDNFEFNAVEAFVDKEKHVDNAEDLIENLKLLPVGNF